MAGLLRLFPARFRERHGDDLLGAFGDQWDECASWRLGVRTIGDMLRGAFLEHLAEMRRGRLETPVQKGGPDVTVLWQDLRFAARVLMKSRTFALTAVLTLALGIGATSSIYSVVHSVLVKGLPYLNSEQLVLINEALPQASGLNVSWPDYLDWRAQNQAFSDMAVFRPDTLSVRAPDGFQTVSAGWVSASLFPVLGARTALGRALADYDDRPGAAPVAVVSYRYWESQLGGDPKIAGEQIATADGSYTIAGVLAPDFRFEPWEFDVFLPVGLLSDTPEFLDNRANHPGLQAVARMREDVSLEQARADMDSIMKRLAAAYPESNAEERAVVAPMAERLIGSVRTSLLTLLGAVGFVLLIVCANVAHLALSHSTARQREFAIRVAIGASRGRLIRQVLTESTLLSLAGGALGLLGASAGVPLLVSLYPRSVPGLRAAHLDWNVCLFTLGVCVFTGLAFGLAPMFQASRIGHGASLNEAASGRQAARMRSALFVSEVAIAVVVTIGAGLLLRSLAAVLDSDLGFRPDHLLALEINRPDTAGTPNPQFFGDVVTRISGVPGVESADAVMSPPLAGTRWTSPYQAADADPAPSNELPWTALNMITPGYFETAGARLLAGRPFSESDKDGAPRVAILNESLARSLWPGESAVGKRIDVMYADGRVFEVVGVVSDVKQFGAESLASAEVYVPHAQMPVGFMTVLVRTSVDPASLVQTAVDVVHELDSNQPVSRAAPMLDAVSSGAAQRRFTVALLGVFSGLALVLAGVGVFSVMACSVTQRTRELAIRLAVGAQPSQVFGLILGSGIKLSALGLSIGLAAAFALSRFLESMLFGVQPHDGVTFAAVAALLAGIALVACLAPARRAALVDPVHTLGQE